VRRSQPVIPGFEKRGGGGTNAKACGSNWKLEEILNLEPATKQGAQSYNHKELSSANSQMNRKLIQFSSGASRMKCILPTI